MYKLEVTDLDIPGSVGTMCGVGPPICGGPPSRPESQKAMRKLLVSIGEASTSGRGDKH